MPALGRTQGVVKNSLLTGEMQKNRGKVRPLDVHGTLLFTEAGSVKKNAFDREADKKYIMKGKKL